MRECRTPELLVELAARYPVLTTKLTPGRRLLATARHGDQAALTAALRAEEDRERALDRIWWQPLRAELEQWPLDRRPT